MYRAHLNVHFFGGAFAGIEPATGSIKAIIVSALAPPMITPRILE